MGTTCALGVGRWTAKMKDQEIAEVLARATKHIMEQTGDPFEVAVKKAKLGFKEYIRMRLDAMHALVAEGYSVDEAFTRAKQLVNLGVSMGE